MDAAYEDVASSYGLACGGCADNCCTQLFHHRTQIEFLYLYEGFKKADSALKDWMLRGAREFEDYHLKGADAGPPPICPVNSGGLCSLYEFRPMICRLHGLPHEFTMPDGKKVGGGGCLGLGSGSTEGAEPSPLLDRTPFYTGLADIERSLRKIAGHPGGCKRTTARMLMEMEKDLGQDEGPA